MNRLPTILKIERIERRMKFIQERILRYEREMDTHQANLVPLREQMLAEEVERLKKLAEQQKKEEKDNGLVQ
jgi:hypothetical protein